MARQVRVPFAASFREVVLLRACGMVTFKAQAPLIFIRALFTTLNHCCRYLSPHCPPLSVAWQTKGKKKGHPLW